MGGTQRGGPSARAPSLRGPPGPCLRLSVIGKLRASLQNLPQPSTHKDPPAFPRGDRALGGPVCIWVPGVCAWVLGLKKKIVALGHFLDSASPTSAETSTLLFHSAGLNLLFLQFSFFVSVTQ